MSTWTVSYGCEEWQQWEEFPGESEARDFYQKILEEPVTLGLWTMDYAHFYGPDYNLIATWDDSRDEEE